MANKESRLAFRNTPTGSISGLNVSTLDLNDSTHRTAVLYASTATGYRYVGGRSFDGISIDFDGKGYNNSSSNTLVGNCSVAANAGYGTNTNANAALLMGHGTLTSVLTYFDDPGTYKIRAAAGSSSANTSTTYSFAIFDGDPTDLRKSWKFRTTKKWTAGMSNSSAMIVSSVDKSVWITPDYATIGACGSLSTDEPRGTGTQSYQFGVPGWYYTDSNGIVWKRVDRNDRSDTQLFAEVLITTTVGNANTVGDVNGSNVSVDTWGSNYVNANISGKFGNKLCIVPLGTCILRCITFEKVTPFTLSAITVDKMNFQTAGTTPTLYAMERPGLRVLRLRPTCGENSYTLGGDLASYFTVTKYNSEYWLTTSSTQIPDALAGSRTLTLTQSDAASTNGTYMTTLTCTVVSSGGKSAYDEDDMDSMLMGGTWYTRKQVKDRYLARTIIAPDGEAADFTRTAYNISDLQTHMQEAAANPGSKYEIQCHFTSNSAYNGTISTSVSMNTGKWLRIKPAAGQDPQITTQFTGKLRHVRFTGLRFTQSTAIGPEGSQYGFLISDPGVGGIYLKLRIDNCSFGLGYRHDWEPETFAQAGYNYQPFSITHGELLEIDQCSFMGNRAQIIASAVHLLCVTNCDTQYSTNDFIQNCPFNAQTPWNTTRGVFENDDIYTVIYNNKSRNEINFPEFANPAHTDFFQVVRSVNSNNWHEKKGTTSWSNTTQFVVWYPETMSARVYKVQAQGVFGFDPPTSTDGLDETNGTCTVRYVNTIPAANNWVWAEKNTLISSGPYRFTAIRQFMINSDLNRGHPFNGAIINNASATPNAIGLTGAEGDTWFEFNTLVGASDLGNSSIQNIWAASTLSPAVGQQFVNSTPYGSNCKLYVVLTQGTFGTSAPTTNPVDPVTGLPVPLANGSASIQYVTVIDSQSQTAYNAGIGYMYFAYNVYSDIPYNTDYYPVYFDNTNNFVDFEYALNSTDYNTYTANSYNPNTYLNGPISQCPSGVFQNVWHFPELVYDGSDDEEVFATNVRSYLKPATGKMAGVFVSDGDVIPPTSYSFTTNAGSTNYINDAITLTFTLNRAATSSVIITPSPSGVSGSLSAATVTIPIGQVTGNLTYTPTSAGTLTISVSDNAGLTDPSAVVLTISAPSVDPTSYTQTLSRTSVPKQVPVTITYTLNQPATSTVVITPGSNLSGTFSASTVTILSGQHTGQVTFTPSVAGTATLTATNSASLTNPSSAQLISLNRNRRLQMKLRM